MLLSPSDYHCTAWEDQPSFLTCVHSYFVAEFFAVEELKEMMLSEIHDLTKSILGIFGRDRQPLWQMEENYEKHHLESFLLAIETMETCFGWRAKLQKAIYDAGERLAARLLELPAFQDFVNTEMGKNFARAIGLRDI
jgi:hypothetical protein